jgi:hypothetical protein
MYAVIVEVNTNESHVEQARRRLPEVAVPHARELGARAGYWLSPSEGRGIAVMIFDQEQEARKAAEEYKDSVPLGGPDVSVRSTEVREVIANL